MLGRLGDIWDDPTLDPGYVSGYDPQQLPTYGENLYQGNQGGVWAGASLSSVLSQLIKAGNGVLIVAGQDPVVGYARSRWWQYSVTITADGHARISENNYVLYGGIGAAALLVVLMLNRG